MSTGGSDDNFNMRLSPTVNQPKGLNISAIESRAMDAANISVAQHISLLARNKYR